MLHGEMQKLIASQVALQTVSGIAHELNQPLNAVTAFGEAALRFMAEIDPPPAQLGRAVEGMATQAERAGAVVRELLRFLSHADTFVAAMDLNDLVREAVMLSKASGLVYGRLEVGENSTRCLVLANRLQVEKVILNLVRNGVESMRDAGVAREDARITVRIQCAADKAQVSVSDTGPGLDAGLARRIFDPFFTTKSRGIGKGLAISRSLVESHGGDMWLESVPGCGATFHFTLPLIKGLTASSP